MGFVAGNVSGGETTLACFSVSLFHQNPHIMKTNDKKQLTSENGRPIADNQNTQTAGHRAPVTLQDTWLLEKMAHFDREVIPERRMHAKGAGAYGTFTVTNDISMYIRNCFRADPTYGEGVAAALGLSLEEALNCA